MIGLPAEDVVIEPGLVSVIIPVYNMDRFLRDCLDSVLSQSYRDIEAICIDDGSTDSSPAILAEYAAKDRRVIVITQANAGSGPARNAGMAAAKGEFLMFLDPDDMFSEKETVEKLHDAVATLGLAVARGRVDQVGPDGRTPVLKPFVIPMPWPPAGRRSYRELQTPAGFCQCLYRRRLIVDNKIFFPSFRRCQDPAFFIRAMVAAGDFVQIDDFTLTRRNGYKGGGKKSKTSLAGQETLKGQQLAIEIAERSGLEKIVDMFGRITGRRKEDLQAAAVRRLCAVGTWVQPLPSEEYVDAFFDRFDAGEFHDVNLFKLIQRVMTPPRQLRLGPEQVLLRRLSEARRNGSLKLRDYRRRRRFLLLWLLFKARFCVRRNVRREEPSA